GAQVLPEVGRTSVDAAPSGGKRKAAWTGGRRRVQNLSTPLRAQAKQFIRPVFCAMDCLVVEPVTGRIRAARWLVMINTRKTRRPLILSAPSDTPAKGYPDEHATRTRS